MTARDEYAIIVHSTHRKPPWRAYSASVARGTIERYAIGSTAIHVYRPTAQWAWRAADRRLAAMLRRERREAARDATARRVTGYADDRP